MLVELYYPCFCIEILFLYWKHTQEHTKTHDVMKIERSKIKKNERICARKEILSNNRIIFHIKSCKTFFI